MLSYGPAADDKYHKVRFDDEENYDYGRKATEQEKANAARIKRNQVRPTELSRTWSISLQSNRWARIGTFREAGECRRCKFEEPRVRLLGQAI